MIKPNPSGVRRNPPRRCGGLLSSSCQSDGQHKVAQELDHAAKSTAPATDPHSGQCLLTNLNEAVELRRLAYAWGLRREQVHLDTRHNFCFLRADWHRFFDQNKLILVPEYEILETLHKLTITQAPEDRFQINLHQTFGCGTFKYNLVPLRELQAPIYRFEGPRGDGVSKLDTYKYPYNTLALLCSHVEPQYVVFNSGKKLRSFSYARLLDLVADIQRKDILPSLLLIIKLHQRWTTSGIPNDSESPCSDDEDDIQSTSTSESTGVLAPTTFGIPLKKLLGWQRSLVGLKAALKQPQTMGGSQSSMMTRLLHTRRNPRVPFPHQTVGTVGNHAGRDIKVNLGQSTLRNSQAMTGLFTRDIAT
ncbi:hypothetical protein L210DRAFT_3650097 [Boletus edulis BED1]|uniref:HNH nuclease domain-containing protein n=1 Tax=Boletus edulis BED1 TaxID=1328754 RepID=A0AAD4BJT6_BOLED|nr:hypothetical protein L210DRAFT_3650097 [Boletus edulis BED1]